MKSLLKTSILARMKHNIYSTFLPLGYYISMPSLLPTTPELCDDNSVHEILLKTYIYMHTYNTSTGVKRFPASTI